MTVKNQMQEKRYTIRFLSPGKGREKGLSTTGAIGNSIIVWSYDLSGGSNQWFHSLSVLKLKDYQ